MEGDAPPAPPALSGGDNYFDFGGGDGDASPPVAAFDDGFGDMAGGPPGALAASLGDTEGDLGDSGIGGGGGGGTGTPAQQPVPSMGSVGGGSMMSDDTGHDTGLGDTEGMLMPTPMPPSDHSLFEQHPPMPPSDHSQGSLFEHPPMPPSDHSQGSLFEHPPAMMEAMPAPPMPGNGGGYPGAHNDVMTTTTSGPTDAVAEWRAAQYQAAVESDAAEKRELQSIREEAAAERELMYSRRDKQLEAAYRTNRERQAVSEQVTASLSGWEAVWALVSDENLVPDKKSDLSRFKQLLTRLKHT
eukprot:CAMPEP_0197613418 /NCGR_PEP_ID=MMETSP1326-20131121/59010_1 /TAXON_ID=1155430 /ORGANISM="Genus nov. species nov., Strain RCC2288" /LENGTH=299 /DNA_ID=CAMNT_0043182281 /DNA_START=61 /DNA_END=960 /DNA_ORIENTATION=+